MSRVQRAGHIRYEEAAGAATSTLHMTRRRHVRSRRSDDTVDVDVLVTGVYERHAGAIAAYALRRADAADAADVVADTFLVAWRRHGEMPDEPNTLPWLYGVARRVLANQRRSRHRRTKLHDRLRNEFVEFDDRIDRHDDTEEFRRVAAALDSLTDDDAELLRLTAWEGLSPTELALTMDLEPDAVRQRLRRARQRLRHRLASDDRTPRRIEPTREIGSHRRHVAAMHDPGWSAGGGS